jgi:hypothetical protein
MPWLVPLVIIDVPLTLIADTVLLPVDLLVTAGVPKNQHCYGQPIPITFSQYTPEATWGKRSQPGVCVAPTITIEQAESPRVAVDVGLQNEVLSKALGLKDPTLFIHLHTPRTLFDLYTSGWRKPTSVRVKATANTINIELADGTSLRLNVPELTDEIVFAGEKVIQVTLKDVEPQSLVVTVPTLIVDGKELGGGTIRFTYEQTTAPCKAMPPNPSIQSGRAQARAADF